MSRSKSIGTAVETAVARYAQAHGFPLAERLALRGVQDHGDVRLCPGLHVECKGGKMAAKAGPGLIDDWLDEAEREGHHSGAYCFLVLKRAGYGNERVGRWRAISRMESLIPGTPPPLSRAAVEMDLSAMLDLMRHMGYGAPLEEEQAS